MLLRQHPSAYAVKRCRCHAKDHIGASRWTRSASIRRSLSQFTTRGSTRYSFPDITNRRPEQSVDIVVIPARSRTPWPGGFFRLGEVLDIVRGENVTGRMVGLDWRRALHGMGVWVSLALVVAIMALSFAQYGAEKVLMGPHPAAYFNAYQAMLSGLGASPNALLYLMVPVLAVLPNGDSLAVDRATGADAHFLVRAGWPGYLWGRLVGNSTAAAATMFTGLILSSVLGAALYPVALPPYLGSQGPVAYTHQGVYGREYQPFVWPSLFWHAPVLYVLLAMGVVVLATAVIAGIATLAAVWVRRRLVVLVIAIAVFLAGDVILQLVGWPAWIPSEMVGGYLVNYTHLPVTIAVYWIVPAGALIAVMWWRIRIRDWPYRREWH